MGSYQKKFEKFWNRDDVALTYAEARREKTESSEACMRKMEFIHVSREQLQDVEDPIYRAAPNGYALTSMPLAMPTTRKWYVGLGKPPERIEKEVRDFGRVDSWTELDGFRNWPVNRPGCTRVFRQHRVRHRRGEHQYGQRG